MLENWAQDYHNQWVPVFKSVSTSDTHKYNSSYTNVSEGQPTRTCHVNERVSGLQDGRLTRGRGLSNFCPINGEEEGGSVVWENSDDVDSTVIKSKWTSSNSLIHDIMADRVN